MTVKHGMREPLVRQQFSVLTVVLTTQNPRSEKSHKDLYTHHAMADALFMLL